MQPNLVLTQLSACALALRATASMFGTHPYAPAAHLIAKCALAISISYIVWTELKWF